MAVTVKNPFTSSRLENLQARIHVATKEQLVRVTRELTDENQAKITAQLGAPAPTKLYVDGSLGKPLESAERVTLTEFELFNHVIDEALRLLITASPVGPPEGGHYRDDHWLFIDGVRIEAEIGAPVSLERGSVATILNRRLYARKIEGGFARHGPRNRSTRRPGLSVQAPDGVYQITSIELRRRFGKVASILYTFRSEGGGDDGRGGYPALVISAFER